MESTEKGVSERLDMKQSFLASTCDHRCWYSLFIPPCLCSQPLDTAWAIPGITAVAIVMGQWQGFHKNWKDPCLLSFTKSAPGCSPMWLALCSRSVSSLLLFLTHWPSAISTFFWFPKAVHCLLPGSFQTLGFLWWVPLFLDTQWTKSQLKFRSVNKCSWALTTCPMPFKNRQKALFLWTHLLSLP